jgi:hypothetical protein
MDTQRWPRRSTVKPDQALQAIIDCKGILADAAKLLGMSRSNLVRMAQNSSKLARALKDQRDALVDFTEKKLFQRINEGDTRAIIYCLSTIGRTRGWVLPRGTELNVGDTTNVVTTTIQNVVVQAIPSGEFIDPDDASTIEGSVAGAGPGEA